MCITLRSPNGVFATIITDCKIWIHSKTTQFKYLVCFSCNSPDDDLEEVETCSLRQEFHAP
jgi:hypothetical protein